eukprot:1157037-Pelagomonas_calceolata.AAC.4
MKLLKSSTVLAPQNCQGSLASFWISRKNSALHAQELSKAWQAFSRVFCWGIPNLRAQGGVSGPQWHGVSKSVELANDRACSLRQRPSGVAPECWLRQKCKTYVKFGTGQPQL